MKHSNIRTGDALRSLASKLPLTAGLHELDTAPRRFLLFIVFNVVSWQCIIGPANILFARKIGMPPSWVGFLLAFAPLSMLLVLATGLMVMHWGAKRVMFLGWFFRNACSCLIFALPWAMAKWGPPGGWWIVMASTFGFCLMRAWGVGGWFPWLHEVVPVAQRGAYFSGEASVTQLLNIGVAVIQAVILQGDPSIARFLAIYGIGILAGFVSLLWMSRIPGGAASGEEASLATDFASYRRAFADRRYMKFIVTASLCFSMITWLGSSYVMFMRDSLGMSSRAIMAITALASVCIMFTVRHWARFAEHGGSGRAIALAQTGHAVCSLGCLLLVPGTAWARWGIVPLIVLASMFGSAFWMSVHRAMLGFVKTEDRVGYTNLWTVATAIAFGFVPIFAGMAIDHLDLWGFRACFLMAGLGGLCAAALIRRVAGESSPARWPSGLGEWLLFLPRTVGQVFRVTAGLDESNR